MSESVSSREVISFCQMLSVALRSGQAIPDSLSRLAGKNGDSASSRWSCELARKLSEGYSIKEACRELADFDPVLARLLPLIGQNRLIKVLEIYTGFLVNLEMVKENLKTVLFYPMIVIALLIANLVQMNLFLFPRIYEQLVASGASIPLLLKLLYFAEIRLWPFSLPLPIIMAGCLVLIIRGIYTKQVSSQSVVARLARVGVALRLQEVARIQGIASLYLQAGFSLTSALETSASFAETEDGESLARVREALAHGESPVSAFQLSAVLQNMIADDADAKILAEKLKYVSESNYRHSASMLKKMSADMFLAALLLTGLFVAIITSGVFDSYYWVMWSFT